MRPYPHHFRVHATPTVLLAWVQLLKPLARDHDAVAIAREALRREHPDIPLGQYEWTLATVALSELRQYVVRVPSSLDPPVISNGGISCEKSP